MNKTEEDKKIIKFHIEHIGVLKVLLSSSFRWGESPQGFDYWAKVYDNLLDMKIRFEEKLKELEKSKKPMRDVKEIDINGVLYRRVEE